MENNGTLKAMLNDFLSAYVQRDRDIAFRDWLRDALRERLPDLSAEAGAALVDGILGAIDGFDRRLREVEEAPASGLSKEEWLAEQIMDGCSALPPDTAGERLLAMERGLIQSNADLLSMDGVPVREVPAADADPAGWNAFTLKKKAREIAKQAGMAGLGVAANAARHKLDGDGSLNLGEAVNAALQDGVPTDPEEVKALVAGAIRVAAEQGLIAGLSKDTPLGLFCDMAGFAVEGAEAIFDAANGGITPLDAAERVCKAGIAAYGCVFAEALRHGIICEFPVVGPIAVELLGGLFDHLKSPQFADNVYTVLHDAAVATWEGIKQSAGQMPAPFQRVAQAQTT